MIVVAILLMIWGSVLAQDRLYIVQGGDESLAEITLSSGQVNDHVLDLGLWCNEVTVHGTHLFIANSGDNTVQEINAATNTTIRNIPIADGINPWSVALIGEDTIAVTCWVSRNVLLLDYDSGQMIGSLTMPTGPEGILVLDDRLIVCETGVDFPNYAPGYLRVYDRANMQLLDSVQVGVNAQSVALDNQGRLHVVCTGDYGAIPGEIYVINATTLDVDSVLNVGGIPNTVSFSEDHAYVAAGGFGDSGYIYRYALDGLEILNDSSDPISTGSGASDIEVAEDGTFYVSCLQADEVQHHAANGTPLQTYPVSDGPGYMALYPGQNDFSRNELPLPSEISLSNAYPNPFNSGVFLQFSAPIRSMGEVLIVNDLGQEVAWLVASPGTTQVRWDGMDASGWPTTSGVYFATIGEKAIRLVLMK